MCRRGEFKGHPVRRMWLFADEGVWGGRRVGAGIGVEVFRGWKFSHCPSGRPRRADATRSGFGCPDLTMFCRLDELGLVVTGQRLEPDRAVLACRVVEPDDWCHRCGCQGVPRGTVIRRLAHEPFGWRPTTLHGHGPPLPLRRVRARVAARHQPAAEPRAKLSRRGLRWALEGLVVPAPHRRPGRRGARRVVEHRQRRRPRRRPTRADRRPAPVRRRRRSSASTSTSCATRRCCFGWR